MNSDPSSRNCPRDQRKKTVQPVMDCTIPSKLPYAERPQGALIFYHMKLDLSISPLSINTSSPVMERFVTVR